MSHWSFAKKQATQGQAPLSQRERALERESDVNRTAF